MPPGAESSALAPRASAPDASRSQPTEAEIRVRAYEMYLQRGAADGADFDDWLRAEQELTAGV